MSTPNVIPPPGSCPFVRGRRYRVRKDFVALRDIFTAGEEMVFDRDAWSRYDGITGYFFDQAGHERLRIWDIYDHEDVNVWKELFEELPEPARGADLQELT